MNYEVAQSLLCLLEVGVAQLCELVISKLLLLVELVHVVGLRGVLVFWRQLLRSICGWLSS
jgi:hypothetical protein